MKSPFWTLLILAICLLLGLGSAPADAAEPAKFKVGDPAPPLAVAKWVKGEPVKEFEKGKVYVIECWATWCGPCRAAIPHVTELQKQFKDKGVVIIGMNVWEEDADKVEPFVKDMGDKMDYRVATDDVSAGAQKGKMALTWLAASGQRGIPCSFVVDKQGKIAWIGHPMNGLDKVIGQIVEDKFDPAKDAEKKTRLDDVNKKIKVAADADDWDKVLAGLDEVIAIDPMFSARASMGKFQVLLTKKKDEPTAYALAAKIAEDKKAEPQILNALAWMILDAPGLTKRDNVLALKLATQADDATKHEVPQVLDTLARAQLQNGQVEKAVETQTLAIAKAPEGQFKDDMLKKLADYKLRAEKK